MDQTTVSRTKPRCRLFDRAINSVKNQSSCPKVKIIRETGRIPCLSSKNESSNNAESPNLVAIKEIPSSEVQYSYVASEKSKTIACVPSRNKSSNVDSLSLVAIKQTPEVQYSSHASEELKPIPCISARNESSINVDSQNLVAIKQMSTPEVQYLSLASEESKSGVSHLKDISNHHENAVSYSEESWNSSSNSSWVDYNLPIFQSNCFLDNPDVLPSSSMIGDENIFENTPFPQASFFLPRMCNDELPESSCNVPGTVNPCKSKIFKEQGYLQSDLPCSSEVENLCLADEASGIDPSDIVKMNNTLKSHIFRKDGSEGIGYKKPSPTLRSNTRTGNYSVNNVSINDLDFRESSESRPLVDHKCVNVSVPKQKHTFEPHGKEVDLIIPHGSHFDNQDSGYMDQNYGFQPAITSVCSLPLNILISGSKCAIDGVKDSRSNLKFNNSLGDKAYPGRTVKVTVEISDSETFSRVDKHSLKRGSSDSSSDSMHPITVQVAECEDEFSESPMRFSSDFPTENPGRDMSTHFKLPVAILISESENSCRIQQNPANSSNIHKSAMNKANGISANNVTYARDWNRASACFETTRDKFCFGEKSRDENQDQFLAKMHCGNSCYLPANCASARDKCMRNLMPKDGGGDVLNENFMYDYLTENFKHTNSIIEEAPGKYCSQTITSKSNLESFRKSELEVHPSGLKAFKPNNFSPENLCESCFLEYSFQFSMFITQFKSREIDTAECTCNPPSADSFSEEPSEHYGLPKFSSPESTNPKDFDLTLSPINGSSAATVYDWNLSKLPNDFSLPISNSCCELSPIFHKEEENINSATQFGVKTLYSCRNHDLGDSNQQVGSENISTNLYCEERLESHDTKCLVPGYDLKMLYSSEFDHKFIDSHCHLDFLFQKLRYRGTFSEYKSMNEATFPKSYEGCVAVFCEPDTFINKSNWEKYLGENVWATFGCHPHFSRFYCEKYENAILEALNHSQVRALGEIGLDYSKNNHCTKEIQHKVFRRQLRICVSKRLPLVLHCRDSHQDTLKLAKEILPQDQKIHLHCFTDTWHWAKEWMDAFPNLCIGFTNHITLNSTRDVIDVVKNMPLNRVLLETDAPYFLPREVQIRKYSHPGMAIHVAAQIAEIKDIPIEEVLYWTRRNTSHVYGI